LDIFSVYSCLFLIVTRICPRVPTSGLLLSREGKGNGMKAYESNNHDWNRQVFFSYEKNVTVGWTTRRKDYVQPIGHILFKRKRRSC